MSILECKALSKNYGRVQALQNIDLSLDSGRIIGLVGPNGSGKTTLIKLAQHLLTPTSGTITVDGMLPGPETKAIVSYLPDRDFLPPWMNLEGLTKFYMDFFPDFNPAKSAEMLANLGVPDKMPLGNMSKGTREKVQLIFTMSREAKVYLLDEPIAGVDPATREYILRTILTNYSEEALVLISTHLITDVEPILDEVVFLQNGSLALHENADALRERAGGIGPFREVFQAITSPEFVENFRNGLGATVLFLLMMILGAAASITRIYAGIAIGHQFSDHLAPSGQKAQPGMT